MPDDDPNILKPEEVATLLRVDPKTVVRWACGGRISAICLPGGHYRFRTDQIRAMLAVDSLHGLRFLKPSEVAALFRVDPKTVVRWAGSGRLDNIRLPGGHRRFHEDKVRAMLQGNRAGVSLQQLLDNAHDRPAGSGQDRIPRPLRAGPHPRMPPPA
jgi:excisionase family DNA binding protein